MRHPTPSWDHLWMLVNGVDLHVEQSGPPDATPVVFSHGLLMSLKMFDAQTAALEGRYRVVRYDHRGQGRSQRTKERSISIETLYDDAVALIEDLDLAPCHLVGLSMGGFVAMRVAARRPDLLRSLALLETSAEPEDNAADYRRLNLVVRALGVKPVVKRVLPIMFGETFLTDPDRAADREVWQAHLAGLDRNIWRASTGVIERDGCVEEIASIDLPTLVIVGDEDVATPPAKAQLIQESIAGSELVRIPGAGHSSTIEQPELVNAALTGFLDNIPT
jgi:3-oxoadipate enol-lactonase